ncbi:MAG: phosphoribosyl-AMP cyclohydrolase [Pseudomonadota bacterium]
MTEDKINSLINKIKFNKDGLVAVIAQRASNNEVLMLAWMNEEAFRITMQTGQVTYWSRSRNKLWRKGETSGNTQTLIEMMIDCDGDALLAKIEQIGAACHTGAINCFFENITI